MCSLCGVFQLSTGALYRCFAAAIVLGCVGGAAANLVATPAVGGVAEPPVELPAEMPAEPQAVDPAAGTVTDPGAGDGGATDGTAVGGGGGGTDGTAVGTAAGPAAVQGDPIAMGPTAAVASTITDPAVFAAAEPTFSLYAGFDYDPTTIPPPTVPILDIEGGALTVASAVECAAQCELAPGCNAASYYGDNAVELWPGTHRLFMWQSFYNSLVGTGL